MVSKLDLPNTGLLHIFSQKNYFRLRKTTFTFYIELENFQRNFVKALKDSNPATCRDSPLGQLDTVSDKTNIRFRLGFGTLDFQKGF